MKDKKFNYGGQAVIEGVMIRGRQAVVTAVRRPAGDIAIDASPVPSLYTGRLRRLPLMRGIIILIESMVLGIKSLFYSASIAMEEEKEELSSKAIWGMIASGFVLVVLLFFLAPLFLTSLIREYISSTIVFNLVEGLIRVIIFIAYLKAISLLPDIRRVFTYHGAEHKTVNAYEAGEPMEVEAILRHSKAHTRCGTSFIFTVLVIAILVFSMVGRPALWLMVLSRVALIPLIAAIGYEITHFSALHAHLWPVKILLVPGLLLQSLTTAEPDASQIEVAIAALNRAVELDSPMAGTPQTTS